MWIRKLFFSVLLLSCGWLQAQTVWPAVQSNMYPHIPFMKLVRHEQTVLLGEGNQQTGIFYASLADTYSEQVSNELINDALLKSWSLHSLVRLGTSFVLTFVQDTRILDIRPSSKMAWSYLSTRAHWALSCCSPMSTMLRRTEMGKWVTCC